MGSLRQQGNTIIYETYGERVEICPFGKNKIRFRSSANLHISSENWNLLEQPESGCTIEIDENHAVLTNGKLKAEILTDGNVTYYNAKGEELLAEYWPEERNKIAYHHAREYRHAGGDNYRTYWLY